MLPLLQKVEGDMSPCPPYDRRPRRTLFATWRRGEGAMQGDNSTTKFQPVRIFSFSRKIFSKNANLGAGNSLF